MRGESRAIRERKALARWLAEWRIDRVLSEVSDGCDWSGEAAVILPGSAGARRAGPACGDIRLLYPVSEGAPLSRPVYVALIEADAGGAFTVAPFGRFSDPALPGEWRTGFRALPARVLCLWNRRRISSAALRGSWRPARMPAGKLRKAAAILMAIRSGADPEDVAPGEVGPPARHPLDPRFRYEAAEAAAFDGEIRALEKAAARLDEGTAAGGIVGEGAGAERLLAAEPAAPHEFGKKPRCDSPHGNGERR